jgi:glycerol uptake facilitator-like aquaporin
MSLAHRLTAEAFGTALLLAVIVGSGIMGERLASGNDAVALLANSLATGCGLFVLITILGPIFRRPLQSCGFAIVGLRPRVPVARSVALL